MSIDIKNLQKIISLCRKTGVLELESNGIKIKLSPEAHKLNPKLPTKTVIEDQEPEYSEEDLAFWSSTSPMDGAN